MRQGGLFLISMPDLLIIDCSSVKCTINPLLFNENCNHKKGNSKTVLDFACGMRLEIGLTKNGIIQRKILSVSK